MLELLLIGAGINIVGSIFSGISGLVSSFKQAELKEKEALIIKEQASQNLAIADAERTRAEVSIGKQATQAQSQITQVTALSGIKEGKTTKAIRSEIDLELQNRMDQIGEAFVRAEQAKETAEFSVEVAELNAENYRIQGIDQVVSGFIDASTTAINTYKTGFQQGYWT